MLFGRMSREIDFILHNPFQDTWWVCLKNRNSAHLVFRDLRDEDPDEPLCTTVKPGYVPVGVSYQLYYDKVLDIYSEFLTPMDSLTMHELALHFSLFYTGLEGALFLNEIGLYFDVGFLREPGSWIQQRR